MIHRAALALFLALVLALGGGIGVLATAPGAQAQPAAISAVDYEAWTEVAERAEEAIENARASTSAFEALRSSLSEWRDQFAEARNANASTIATVRQQLEGLGPVPEDQPESAEIATQRVELNTRLADLRAPVQRAEAAFNRADALIREVDRIINSRQTEALLELGPSPLNPTHWFPAIRSVQEFGTQIHTEVAVALDNPRQMNEARANLPLIIILLVIGFVLVVRGRIWSRRLMMRVLGEDPNALRWIMGFLISTGSLFLPLLGVVMLVRAAYATQLVGLRSDHFLSELVTGAAIYLTARWIATRIFPAKESRNLPLNLEDGQRKAGRWYGAMIGFVGAAYHLLRDVSDMSSWTPAVQNVVLFPLLLLMALLVLRIAGLIRAHVTHNTEDSSDENFRNSSNKLVSYALFAVAGLAPFLAAVGYFKLSEYLMFPSLITLAILSGLLIIQRLVIEVYVLVSGNRAAVNDSLIPVIIAFLLFVGAMPLFALAWGMRVTTLGEIWSSLVNGVTLGGVKISPAVFFTLILVFSIGYVATRLLQAALKNSVLPKTRIDAGGQNAVVSGVGYIGIFLAALIAITSAGIDLSSIAIVAGALSVGIGFGLQNIVSNFVSGIILLIERPISEGDWIEVGGTHGTVKSISVRSTVIQTFDRSDVIVPNADFVSGRVTNYTHGNTVGRAIVPVGVAYGTDTRKVETILREIAEAHPMVLMQPPPFIYFKGFGADSLDFEIRAILRDINWLVVVQTEMNHEIARRFTEEGIEIPYAQRDIWIRNPEALIGAPSATPVAQKSAHKPVEQPKDPHAQLSEGDFDQDGAHANGDADADGDGR